MATCGLSPKVLKSLNVKIVKDLKVLAEANDTFVLKDYMKSVYDSVLNATSDHTLALDAARVVPKFVGTTAFNISSVSKLQGLNIAETMQVMNDLLESDLDATEKFLGLKNGDDVKKTLNSLNEEPEEEEETPTEEEVSLNEKFRGKVIYVTPGGGKTTIVNENPNLQLVDSDPIKIKYIENTEWGKANPFEEGMLPEDYIYEFAKSNDVSDEVKDKVNDDTFAELQDLASKGFTVLTGTLKFASKADLAIVVDNASVQNKLMGNIVVYKDKEAAELKSLSKDKKIFTSDVLSDVMLVKKDEVEEEVEDETPETKTHTPIQQVVTMVIPVEEAASKTKNPKALAQTVPSLRTTRPNEVEGTDQTSYRIQRMLLDLLSNSGLEDMSELPLTWKNGNSVGGVYISIMKTGDVKTKGDVDAKTYPYLYVVTNKFGEPITFDDALQPDLNGDNVAYFKMTSPMVKKAAAQNLAERTGLSLAEATKVIERESDEQSKVNSYVLNEDTTEPIVYNITGGSKGIVIVEKAKAQRTRLTDPLLAEASNPKIQIGQKLSPDQIIDKDLKPFEAYYTNDDLAGTYFRVRLGAVRETEFKDTILRLLTAKEILGSEGKPLTAQERKDAIRQFIHLGTVKTKKIKGKEVETLYGISMITDPKDKYAFTLMINDFLNENNGNPILLDLTTPEGLEKAEAAVLNYLESSFKNKNARANINFDPELYSANRKLEKVFEEDGKLVLREIDKTYQDLFNETATVEIAPISDTGALEPLNSYFTLALTEESTNRIYNVEEVDTTDVEEQEINSTESASKPEDLSDTTFDIEDDELFRSTDVANRSKKATQEQIAAAEKWWNSESNPLNKYIPFKAMFDVINSKGVANWSLNGITLFQGSDFTDVYHEAWHGFTQTFMTKKEKFELYKEVRKKSGSFLDHKNVRVRFEDATDLQIEEHLAEEFRQYMLKGQKPTKGATKQNSFFRKIWNILKTLFSDSRYTDIVTDDSVDYKINNLFEKLRVGDLKEYTFSVDNVSFDSLNKGIAAKSKEAEVSEINLQDSLDIVNTVDYFINEWITASNAEMNPDDILRYRELVLKKERTRAEEQELDSFAAKKYTGASRFIQDPVRAYQHAFKGMSKLKEDIDVKLETLEKGSAEYNKLLKQSQTLGWALKEFGDLKNFENNKKGQNRYPKGVIAYHLNKTKLFEDKAKDIDFENISEDDLYADSQRSGIDRKGNESSLAEDAKPEVLWMLESLIDPNKANKYGVPEKSNYKQTIVKIIRATENTQTYELWAEAFNKLADKDPIINQLRQKLGNPTDINNALPANTTMWSNIWQMFNKTRVPLVALTNTLVLDEEGSYELESSNVGVALSESNVVQQSWDGDFTSGKAINQEYMIADEEGTKLNINKLLKDFKTVRDAQAKPFEFFRALGINITDIPEIRKELRNHNLYNVAAYYRNVLAIKNIGLNVRSLKHIVDPASIPGVKKSQKESLVNLSGRYDKLANLEQDYSYSFTNFSKVNAEGNVQFEHSLNNYLTTVVNGINNAETYQELIANPAMSQFNIKTNPFAEYSTWLNSVFDLKTGKKRVKPNGEKVKLQLYNLSGTAYLDQNSNRMTGRASAKSDELSKISLDINLALAGYPELLRHADKSTSYGVRVDGPMIYPKTSPSSSFTLADAVGTKEEIDAKLLERMQGVLYAELTRMQKFHDMRLTESSVFDYKYLEEGKNFHYFDDIIGNDTTLGEKIKELMVSAESTGENNYAVNQVKDNVDGIKDEINAAIIKYFDHLLQKDSVSSDQYYLSKKTKKEINAALPQDLKNNETAINDVVNKVFVYNTFLNNVESTMFLYGDIALYNHAKEELHKRNAGSGSTGTIYRTDAIIKKVIDTLNAKNSYAKELGVEPSVNEFTGSMKTAVAEDNIVSSIYFEQLEKTLGKDGAADYAEQNEADAQGLITIDAYRVLKISQGTWTNEHQKIYNKAIKGESTPAEITKFFPVIKGQYWGPVQSPFANVMAFHKYSLFPLIPSVIKDTNAEIVHKRMVREGIGYLTFESGSKVGNITKQSGFDKLYTDKENKILVDELKSDDPDLRYFTSNTIRLEYLKDQLYIHDEDKSKIIFSTQLRKLVETGLWEEGVPSDFMSDAESTERIKAWDKLKTDEARIKASPNYALTLKYEGLIRQLSGLYKDQLLKQIGWDGVSTIDNNAKSKLIQIAKDSLERDDVGYSRVQALNKVTGDYSGLLDAETIDKIINSLVEKNLVKQKVTGEALVQVANTLMEKAASPSDIDFRSPTKEDFEKYNAKSLPYYEQNLDEEGNPLPTSAMKVKVALRGKFKNLLNFKDLDGNRIGTVERLNELIRNEEWLNKDDNRNAITMIGVRIPVQGVNSMEVMEVYEFLDKSAGNVIIPPTEIVTKSGADFDVDKMTIMMPNIINKTKKLDEAGLEYLKMANPDLNFSEENIEVVTQLINDGAPLWVVSEELEAVGNAIIDYTAGDAEYAKNDKIAGVENQLIEAMRDIILRPENFNLLTTPNSTDIFQKEKNSKGETLVEEAAKYNMGSYNYDALNIKGERKNTSGKKMISPTTTLEPGYNRSKHQNNKVGKEVLGQGAVDNTYNVLTNRIGLIMTEANMTDTEYAALEKEYNDLIQQIESANSQGKRVPKDVYEKFTNIETAFYAYRKHELRLQHNQSGKRISLSQSKSKDGKPISEVISQLMNGWVDVAKKAWVFDVHGNKEMTPQLLFMVQAGVPIREAVLFLSNPLIQQYGILQRRFNSPASLAIDDSYAGNYYRSNARKAVMGLVSPIDQDSLALDVVKEREDFMKTYEGEFTLENIIENLNNWKDSGDDYVYTEFDKAVFYHYLQIEEMSNHVRDIKMSTNVDTSKDGTSVEVRERLARINALAENTFAVDAAEKLKNESPIGAFFNTDLQLNILENLLSFRNHKAVYNQIQTISEDADLKRMQPDKSKRVRSLLNDLNYFIFQNELKYFSIKDLKSHKGFGIKVSDKNLKIAKSALNIKGVAVDTKTGTIDVNLRQLLSEYNSGKYAKKHDGVSGVKTGTFRDFNEYVNFVIEREIYRTQNPLEDLKTSTKFKSKLDYNLKNTKKIEDESQEAFEKRVINNTYENYVRDNALVNIFNYDSLFLGGTSIAMEFTGILKNFPALQDLAIFKQIKSLKDPRTNKLNLKLIDNKIDGDMIDVLNENLEMLSSMTKLNDLIPEASLKDKQEITSFFRKFAIYGHLQGGWSTAGGYALNKLGDQTKVQAIMRKPISEFKQIFDDAMSTDENKSAAALAFLDDYFGNFLRDYKRGRLASGAEKGVNYFRNFTVSDRTSIEPLKVSKKQDVEDYLFDPVEAEAKPLVSPFDLPNAIVVPRLAHKSGGKFTSVLAQTNTRDKSIYVRANITVKEFFDYFEGKADSAGSQQKKATLDVLAQMGNKKYDLAYIKKLLNTPEKVYAFLVLHEVDHIRYQDKYDDKGLLSEHNVGIEARANYNALVRLEEMIAGETVVPETKEEQKRSENETLTGLTYNEKQTEAIDALESFIASDKEKFTIIGKAGTGKTTIMKEVLMRAAEKDPSLRIGIAAVAHKAKQVLSSTLGNDVRHDAHTVASLLGMKEDPERPGNYAPDPYSLNPPGITTLDLIIVDEASMINEETLELIMKMKKPNAKVIFAGDVGQLPPIRKQGDPKEGMDSPTFEIEDQSQLLVRVRQGEESPILPYADNYWNNSREEDPAFTPVMNEEKQDIITDKGVLAFPTPGNAIQIAIEEFRKVVATGDMNIVKYVAYKNATRERVNKTIHEAIFGVGADTFSTNAPLVMTNNYRLWESLNPGIVQGERLTNSEEIIVTAVDARYTDAEGVPVVRLLVKTREGMEYTIVTPDPMADGVQKYRNAISKKWAAQKAAKARKDFGASAELAKQAKSYGERYAPLDLAYAITTHKSQGSTYNTVIVDENDIMSVRPTSNKTKSQAMYTAITRAKNNVLIISSQAPNPTADTIDLITATPTIVNKPQEATFTPLNDEVVINDPVRYLAVKNGKRYDMVKAKDVMDASKNENAIIISSGSRTVDDQGAYAKHSGWQFRNAPNVIYIPNVEQYKPDGINHLIKDDAYGTKDAEIKSDVKTEIDAAMSAIEQAIKDGKTLYWDKGGYGQTLLEKIQIDENGATVMSAGKTYVYLSQQLFEKFGFINPGYLTSKTFKESVDQMLQNPSYKEIQEAKTQAVEKFHQDSEVQDFIKQCLGK
jgi:exodeoxyribonuclease-5